MNVGDVVCMAYDKLSTDVGRVTKAGDGWVTVLWEQSKKEITYGLGEVRPERPGEADQRRQRRPFPEGRGW